MRRWIFGTVWSLLVAMVVAGCGGGTASSVASSAPSAAVPSAAEPSAAEPSAAEPASAAPSSGGTAVGVCELISAGELATILGVGSVTHEVIAGPPDTCIVRGPEGNAIVSWSHTTQGGRAVYDALALPSQSRAVPGIGDAAAFVENTGLLIAKGDGLVVIVISGQADLDEAAGEAASEKIGAVIAGKM